MQMGLGFASMVDPANGISVPVLGQFFNMLVILLFLSVNGHLVVLEILAESFVTLPVGRSVDQSLLEVAGKLGWVLGAGLLLVLPAITALLVVNLAFGLMTRRAATEYLLHRLSADPGARSDHRLDRHGRYLRAVPDIRQRGADDAARAGGCALMSRALHLTEVAHG